MQPVKGLRGFFVNMSVCPLCQSSDITPFHSDKRRQYLRCRRCFLVHVPQSFHVSVEREKQEYDKHDNSEEHAGYRRFLSRVSEPLTALLPQNSQGLDFGCGPGPVLSSLIQDKGFFVEIYDPLYFPFTPVLRRKYDFVTATEVLEHLRQPRHTLNQVFQCLKPGGYFAVMTKLVTDQSAFARWHYINDPTHIIFFSQPTYQWLCQHLALQIIYQKKDVAIFRKNFSASEAFL